VTCGLYREIREFGSGPDPFFKTTAIDKTIRGSLVGLFQGGLPNAAFLNELSMPTLLAQHIVQMFSSSVGLRTQGRTRNLQKRVRWAPNHLVLAHSRRPPMALLEATAADGGSTLCFPIY
jgi:hypothetical protein